MRFCKNKPKVQRLMVRLRFRNASRTSLLYLFVTNYDIKLFFFISTHFSWYNAVDNT